MLAVGQTEEKGDVIEKGMRSEILETTNLHIL